MTNKYTAAQAREDSGPTFGEKVESAVDRLLESIKLKAQNPDKKGVKSIKTGWEHRSDKNIWVDGGYNGSDEWKAAKKMLEDLGYKVSFYYNDGSYFVDMYTLVEW